MNFKNILAVSLLTSIFFSCSKEHDPVRQTYTKCELVSIKLTSYPTINSGGKPWDNAAIPDNPAPDIYITISKTGTNELLDVTGEKSNLLFDELPIICTYTTPFKIPDFNGHYTLMLWDDDANISSTGSHDGDDRMGVIENLSPSNMAVLGYPSTSVVSSSDGLFQATLTLRWYN